MATMISDAELNDIEADADANVGAGPATTSRLIAAIRELQQAITKTLNENGHLADGEVCTLIHLKRAIGIPKCTRAFPCQYQDATQCARDTMLGAECPRVCECSCHMDHMDRALPAKGVEDR